jgi:hypothetical protein
MHGMHCIKAQMIAYLEGFDVVVGATAGATDGGFGDLAAGAEVVLV